MERIDKVQNLIPEKPEFVHSNQEKGEDRRACFKNIRSL